MATVSAELPDFITPGSRAERIRWQDETDGLADVVSLSIGQGTTVILTRFQINGDQGRVIVQTVNTLSDTGSGSGPSLSDAWERQLNAVRVQAAGLTELTIGGPLVTGNDLTDTTEPYVWEPADNITYIAGEGLEEWVAAFKAAYVLDSTLRATLTLSDQAAPVIMPLDAAGTLVGGLAGSVSGAASLSPLPIDAAGTLDGGLAGSLEADASLGLAASIDAAGTLVGGLVGSLAGAASTGSAPPLSAAGTLDAGLKGSLAGAASLSPLPLDAAGMLTGGLVGSLEADAQLYTPPAPPSRMKLWLIALLLPWDELSERWATACAIAIAFDGMIAAGTAASHEWSPVTCRSTTLTTWGRILQRPRRDGETVAAHRLRLATWRSEPVGTSGWVRDEVARVTGTERVIEFPREGFIGGYSSLPSRFGIGPVFAIGAPAAQRADLETVLEPGIESTCGIQYINPDVFDVIAADP